MPYDKIEVYRADWNVSTHTGKVSVKVGTHWHSLRPESPAEFMAMVDLLRHERPVYFTENKSGMRISTEGEEIGEEET